MVAVDLHAHAVPRDLIDALGSAHPALAPELQRDGDTYRLRYPTGRSVGPFPRGMFDLDARIADMDRWRIDVQVLSIAPGNFFYEVDAGEGAAVTALQNDALVEVARTAPERLKVIAGLPLQDPDAAVREIQRSAVSAEVVGVHIGTNVAGENLDHPSLEPVWAALELAGLPVVIHPCSPLGGARCRSHELSKLVAFPTETTIAAGALIFGGVASAHPELRFCLLHGGGFLPYQVGRFDHGWSVTPSLRDSLEQSPSSLAARFYYDTITHSPASLRFLIDQVGADHVVLGSDYAFDMGPLDPVGFVEEAVADPDTAERILSAAERLIEETASQRMDVSVSPRQ